MIATFLMSFAAGFLGGYAISIIEKTIKRSCRKREFRQRIAESAKTVDYQKRPSAFVFGQKKPNAPEIPTLSISKVEECKKNAKALRDF